MEITAPNSVTCLFLFNSEGKRAANPFWGPHHVLILLQLPCSLGSGAVTGSAEPGGSFPKLSPPGGKGDEVGNGASPPPRGGGAQDSPTAGWGTAAAPHASAPSFRGCPAARRSVWFPRPLPGGTRRGFESPARSLAARPCRGGGQGAGG